MKIVNVGGKEYEIDGLPHGGTLPMWQLLRQNGQPMMPEMFAQLSDAEKRELEAQVQEYIRETTLSYQAEVAARSAALARGEKLPDEEPGLLTAAEPPAPPTGAAYNTSPYNTAAYNASPGPVEPPAGVASRDPNDKTGEAPAPEPSYFGFGEAGDRTGFGQAPFQQSAKVEPPSRLEGVAAKAEVGTFTRDVAVGLEGVEVKAAVASFAAEGRLVAATDVARPPEATFAGEGRLVTGADTAAGITTDRDWEYVEAFVRYQADAPLLEARDGRIDLAPTTASYEALAPRIEAARVAIEDLIGACASGNRQHAPLGDFAEQYRAALDDLKPGDPGIIWYVTAQKVEDYRSNYVASSRRQPGEYPPLAPALSTEIDAVARATGMLARLFPEIAKSQDDFEKYAGREVGVRRAERELLNAALSDLADRDGIFTPRALAGTKAVAELDAGPSPDDAAETRRTVATKAGLLRAFMSAIAKIAIDQKNYVIDNIRTKGPYDIAKEIIKNRLTILGFTGVLGYLTDAAHYLTALAAQLPSMFDFVNPLLRLLGIM